MGSESERKVVFRASDFELLESLDGTMRDIPMVTNETAGSDQYSAGFFWLRPGVTGHADTHPGMEELYYIFEGKARVIVDDVPHDFEAGDVVLIPAGANHYLTNQHDKPMGLFWALPEKWSNLPDIVAELGSWKVVEHGSSFERQG